MILSHAGLQDISRDIYEAAALDNATGVKASYYITLPNLKRTITQVVILQIILHFEVFGQSHLMTRGGPNDTTRVLVRYIYQTGFRDSKPGRPSAMAVFPFVIMGAFSAIQFVVGREGHDDARVLQLVIGLVRRLRSRQVSPGLGGAAGSDCGCPQLERGHLSGTCLAAGHEPFR